MGDKGEVMKSDYVVTIHIKGWDHLPHKRVKERLKHYLDYWLHGEATSCNVLRLIRKKPQE